MFIKHFAPGRSFTLRTMMIAVALVAIMLAFISAWWNQPQAVDPFDTLEMIGPSEKKPFEAWKQNSSETADKR
jgi:hypothetical protein